MRAICSGWVGSQSTRRGSRVVLSRRRAVAFAMERNGLYTLITLVMLAVLLLGLFLGKSEGG